MRRSGRGFQPILSDIRLGAIQSNPVPILGNQLSIAQLADKCFGTRIGSACWD